MTATQRDPETYAYYKSRDFRGGYDVPQLVAHMAKSLAGAWNWPNEPLEMALQTYVSANPNPGSEEGTDVGLQDVRKARLSDPRVFKQLTAFEEDGGDAWALAEYVTRSTFNVPFLLMKMMAPEDEDEECDELENGTEGRAPKVEASHGDNYGKTVVVDAVTAERKTGEEDVEEEEQEEYGGVSIGGWYARDEEEEEDEGVSIV